jgi:hypothetical protein
MRARWIAGSIILCCPAMMAAASPGDSAHFGQICSGTETVQIGAQPPQTMVYTIALSIDLAARRYCYATCGREQTYPIADSTSAPLKLADFDTAAQRRRTLLDRNTAQLSDDQRIVMGPIVVVRHAIATCQAGPFKEPFAG